MATVSKLGLQWNEEESRAFTGLSLEALPFPAASLDVNGIVQQVNADWVSAHPESSTGKHLSTWIDAVCGDNKELRTTIAGGFQEVAQGRQPRFEQQFTNGAQHRVSISSLPGGALLLDQMSATNSDAAGDRDAQRSRRMETMGRLVGGVAHDFANLLTLITGHSEMLLDRIGEKDPLRSALVEIHQAAERGSRLTSQLLGFTRGHTGKPRPLDLNALIRDVQRMLRPLIGEYLDFESSLRPGLGYVLADPGQIEQVLMNLILNARDAMPNGGRIHMETSHCELGQAAASAHGIPAGAYALLSISDTGHGMSRECLDRIFEPFFTTKDKGQGTGLGLSTVYSIVKQIGGDVWATSTPGEGACFSICLPVVQHSVDAGQAPSPRRSYSGDETILLVEDEESVRRLMSHVLRGRGYRVLEASNGQEAMEIFEAHGPEIHIVLTDMVMPKMNGRELGVRLRNARPDLPVIYVSGYTDDVLLRTGALSPGMAFLQKPLRPEVLAAKVREALDSASRPFNPR